MPPPDAGQAEAGPSDSGVVSPDGSMSDVGLPDVQRDASVDGGSGPTSDGGLTDAQWPGADGSVVDTASGDRWLPGADLGPAAMDGGVADADTALARD